MAALKPGAVLKSATCTTEIMVVRTPAGADVDVRCGGAPMAPTRDPANAVALDPAFAEPTLVGKRYNDATEQFEFLCTKGGQGSLTLNGAPLTIKVAKALPSSD